MLAVIGHQCAVRPRKGCAPPRGSRRILGRGARRRIDDLQDLGGRGLLLQCLAGLGDQPRILDRDHRLVSKGTDQFDLALAERLDPLPRQADGADHNALAQQRHAQAGTNSAGVAPAAHQTPRPAISGITRASSAVRPVTLPRLGGRGPIF